LGLESKGERGRTERDCGWRRKRREREKSRTRARAKTRAKRDADCGRNKAIGKGLAMKAVKPKKEAEVEHLKQNKNGTD
jgi:hypothetical protein